MMTNYCEALNELIPIGAQVLQTMNFNRSEEFEYLNLLKISVTDISRDLEKLTSVLLAGRANTNELIVANFMAWYVQFIWTKIVHFQA
jgi:hypothetical protein